MESPKTTDLLEDYLKDFVLHHNNDSVVLHLSNNVQIRHVTKKGHTLLAVFWVKVLQHELNFPKNRFIYTQAYDEATSGDVLIVSAGAEVQLMVYMATGTLTIDGRYPIEWFAKHFKELLDNFDPTFADRWRGRPSCERQGQRPLVAGGDNEEGSLPARRTMAENRTATEDYLKLLTNRHIYHDGHLKRVMADAYHIEAELARMSCVQGVWSKAELDSLLCCSTGVLRDANSYVYKLWRSLLHRWFVSKGTRVFLCAPALDERCLRDIVDLFLPSSVTARVAGIFTQSRCATIRNNDNLDTPYNESFFHMKRQVIDQYPPRTHQLIEYGVYKALIYPKCKFSCKFMAGVKDGIAEVMVTSADFNMTDFVSGNLAFVSVTKMPEKTFIEEYLRPLLDQAVHLE